MHDSVDTGNGEYETNGRVIHDEHHIGRAPLAEVLRWSSNIGIVKFSERLTPSQQFETLRDFGFGTPTGVPYPVEVGRNASRAARVVEAVGQLAGDGL